MRYTVFIEIGPLQEIRYAGVSTVTLELCRYWLKYHGADCRFFLGPYLIATSVIEMVVEARGGALLQTLIAQRHAIIDSVANEIRRCPRPVALFPSVKSTDAVFDHSFQIVHDLSFLLNPEFHRPDTIRYHGLTILRDLSSNALNFCVSAATAGDLTAYLGVPADRIVVAHPGGDPLPEAELPFSPPSVGEPPFPYIVIPGTIEPRKNIDLVLETLARLPHLLRQYRWLFMGGPGWLIAFEDRVAHHGLSGDCAAGAIQWLGYVDERQKAFLYRHAELAVYPSFYEGFGIPVVEAMRQGCPVACSFSSGIPEAGGDAAFYFDPTSQTEFAEVLLSALDRCRLDRAAIRKACADHAAKFTWERFARTIDGAIARIVDDAG